MIHSKYIKRVIEKHIILRPCEMDDWSAVYVDIRGIGYRIQWKQRDWILVAKKVYDGFGIYKHHYENMGNELKYKNIQDALDEIINGKFDERYDEIKNR